MALMTVEQRAFIRTLAEELGWSETNALAEVCKAAEGAHPATNQARVARTGRAFEELTPKDAKRLIAWLRLQASDRNVRTDQSRYNENSQALGGTPLTDRERLEPASAQCPQMAPPERYSVRVLLRSGLGGAAAADGLWRNQRGRSVQHRPTVRWRMAMLS